MDSQKAVPEIKADKLAVKQLERGLYEGFEVLSYIPIIFYALAIICGIGFLIVSLDNTEKLSGIQIVVTIGSAAGYVLSIFAVGRVIQLLQQIRDAVRN